MPELTTLPHFERRLVTSSGHVFLLVARRPLVECANEMVQSAAQALQAEVCAARSVKNSDRQQASPVLTPP